MSAFTLPPRPWNGRYAADLYTCQGGAAFGLYLAGFRVVCIDIDPQPRHIAWAARAAGMPEEIQFVQADAVAFIRDCGSAFHFNHASPPCQRYSDTQVIRDNDHPDLIGPTRDALERTGRPFTIENVGGARDELLNPIELCGLMFGLRTYRHRYIEAGGGLVLPPPPHPRHTAPQAKMGRPVPDGWFYQAIGNFSGVDMVRRDMGVGWMNRDGIRECIPPAYGEWIGRQAAAHLGVEAVAA